MEDVCKICFLVTFSILVTLRSLVDAYPFPESARFSLHRPKAVQENYVYGPRDNNFAGNQYYPPALWAEALLQLSETPRDQTADYADEYAYDAGEAEDAYASEVSDSALSEESFRDLLMTYLLRQQEELRPRVQRRNNELKSGKDNDVAMVSSSTSAPSTTATASPTFAPVKFDQGQKEVPILRPPTDSRRQPLSWPKELEESSQENQDSEKQQQHQHSMHKSGDEKGSPAPSISQMKNDLLALQLDDLKPQNH